MDFVQHLQESIAFALKHKMIDVPFNQLCDDGALFVRGPWSIRPPEAYGRLNFIFQVISEKRSMKWMLKTTID